MLSAEVLSPSTRHVDRGLTKSAYEALGTATYLIVDPSTPSIIAWQLVDGEYVEAGRAEGDQELALQQPFPVRILPRELVP